jgi:outer membrane receptor protein involved in Fe transport
LFEEIELTLIATHSFRLTPLGERYQYVNQSGVLKVGNLGLKPEEGKFLDLGFVGLGG